MSILSFTLLFFPFFWFSLPVLSLGFVIACHECTRAGQDSRCAAPIAVWSCCRCMARRIPSSLPSKQHNSIPLFKVTRSDVVNIKIRPRSPVNFSSSCIFAKKRSPCQTVLPLKVKYTPFTWSSRAQHLEATVTGSGGRNTGM